MNRPILTCVLLAFATSVLCAQQPAQTSPYQGQSSPPADETITAQPDQADQPVQPTKPRAGKPLSAPATTYPTNAGGTDDGSVSIAPSDSGSSPDGRTVRPALTSRGYNDPDGDIVHPQSLAPGEVPAGTMIRVRLLTGLSTNNSATGELFKSHVASDVVQDGKVLIPAGAEIDGRVVEVSEGHTGGHGSIRLRPDTVILLDGQRYRMDAQVTGTPGSKTRVNSEGTINAGSRWKKDGLEYGGAAGAGAITGAVIAGPVGALTGSLIGAGAITVHLLTDHPQAKLEPGTVLLITLNSRLNLVATPIESN